ncbi:hypothetical protein AAFC00_004066 [Neodothiora populina]|uniref:Aminoglycoside phosphotransferase domain-containing protein n=1 Tax=Neodothiora populina TaxID=2781224 RepID=A0ABR3PIG4_9PEZI
MATRRIWQHPILKTHSYSRQHGKLWRPIIDRVFSVSQPLSCPLPKLLDIPDFKDASHSFYNYTSGGCLYNDRLRRQERHLVFDVSALLDVVSKAAGRPRESVTNIAKLAEGGYYRVFEVTFSDSLAVIARIPYPCTVPRQFGIASEVATMQYLRLHGIPVPEVLDWTVSPNPVGSKYMIMAKAQGTELEQTWYTMSIEERSNVVKQIVVLESKMFQLDFPASGSIYHQSFLESHEVSTFVPLDSTFGEGTFCIGPSSELLWWYKDRDQLEVRRGPWKTATEVMESVGQRELAWLERFGQPRYPREVMYRESYDKKMVDPATQMRNLRDYLALAPLIVPDDPELVKPIIRHPDLSPSNIFVSESGDITALLDWQYTCILPL